MACTSSVLGGCQLGRMLTEAANHLNIGVVTLDAEGAPAKQINIATNFVNGPFTDPQAIRKLDQQCAVLTVEIEHVDAGVLGELAAGTATEVQPGWRMFDIVPRIMWE
ncbi:phosphoribosylaminoimidazole carboxylase ade2 [Trapelia coarctata]|nr:phosphoribosylaminoimidazole carboxylase ade2 [Trapelia coarctata]